MAVERYDGGWGTRRRYREFKNPGQIAMSGSKGRDQVSFW